MDTKIKLDKTTLELTIEFEGKNEKWAKYISESTTKILTSYEKALNRNFNDVAHLYFRNYEEREKNKIKIIGKDKVILKGNHVGGYNNTSGDVDSEGPKGIFLEFNFSPIMNPSLLFHELGHYWFYRTIKVPWLMEGIVSYLPLVLERKGFLKLKKEEYQIIGKHWGIHTDTTSSWKQDVPAIKDFRGTFDFSGTLWYCKTFKIQFIIHKELGDNKYIEFLQNDLLYNNNSTTEDIVALLKTIKKQNWMDILSGWVFPGEYTKYKWKSFKGIKF